MKLLYSPPLDLRVLHAFNVITRPCNVKTAMDSCTKALMHQKVPPHYAESFDKFACFLVSAS